MRVERRAAELEELEHAKLIKDCNLEASTSKKRAVSVVPFDTPAPPWAPSPTNLDSGAAVAEETRNLPVFTGESPNPGVHIVWSRVSCCLLGLVLGCWDFSLWVSRFLQLEFGTCPSGAVEFDQMDEGNRMNPRYTGVASVLLHDSKLRLFDAAANILRGEFLNQGPVLDCCFHDDSSGYSATASADNTVSRFDFNTGSELFLGSHEAHVCCVEYSHPTGKRLGPRGRVTEGFESFKA